MSDDASTGAAPSGLFDDFAAAAAVEQSQDELDRIEVFVRDGVAVIDRVSQLVGRFVEASGKDVFYRSFDSREMMEELWDEACGRIDNQYVRPQAVDVQDVQVQVASALGFRGDVSRLKMRSEPKVTDLLPKWSARLIRSHFERLIGDPRETRIRQLRDAVLKTMSGDRPAERFRWRCGCHHRDHYMGGLGLPFNDSTTREIGRFVTYVIHLTTGEDPKTIERPVIPFLSDGKEPWDRAQTYRKMKNLAPGIKAFRFTASSAVEVELDPAVLPRFQAEWDKRWPEQH